jgi:hypothetical protein
VVWYGGDGGEGAAAPAAGGTGERRRGGTELGFWGGISFGLPVFPLFFFSPKLQIVYTELDFFPFFKDGFLLF